MRAFLRDNAHEWLEEFRIDGLRWDATAHISVDHRWRPRRDRRIPDGWTLMADINREIAASGSRAG